MNTREVGQVPRWSSVGLSSLPVSLFINSHFYNFSVKSNMKQEGLPPQTRLFSIYWSESSSLEIAEKSFQTGGEINTFTLRLLLALSAINGFINVRDLFNRSAVNSLCGQFRCFKADKILKEERWGSNRALNCLVEEALDWRQRGNPPFQFTK